MVLDKEIESSRDDSLIQESEVLKNEIGTLYHEETMGACVRSRSKGIEEGEKSSAYFLNL